MDRQAIRHKMVERKRILVIVVPMPEPPLVTGCVRRSPHAAPNGRVRMYASQKQSVAFAFNT
jgi:hypothetical protein